MSSNKILLGLDLGYTGCKAVAFDIQGEILASAYREYPMQYPKPGWVVMDPEQIWTGAAESIRQVTTELSDPVTALSVSVMGEAFTPVDADGQPVTETITAFDERGVDQCNQLIEKLGMEKIFNITGQVAGPSHPLPKVCWLKEHQPDTFKRIDKIFCFCEFILHRLGVEPTIDLSMAARSMAYDLQKADWSDTILQAAGLDASLFAPVKSAGTAVGTVAPDVADKLGLSADTIVVVGGHDQPCGAVGAGVLTKGQATYALGTVHVICAVMDAFNNALGQQGFPCYPHVVPGRYVTLAYNFTGGSALKWFRDTFAANQAQQAQQDGKDIYDVLLDEMPDQPSGLFLLPHFSGTGTPWFDTTTRGALLGLTTATTRGQIVKSILEGTTYELAMNLDMLARADMQVNELHAIGGSVKSMKDIQIRTNIMARPVYLMAVREASALGAAILAGVGAEIYLSVEDASRRLAELKSVVQPQMESAKQYGRRVSQYKKIHSSVRQIFRDIIN